MIEPSIPSDEQLRLKTLRGLNLLDTTAEESFDRITRLARRLFDVPIALVSLVDADRQWFKSNQGLAASETARDVSFCGHAILSDEVLVIQDTLRDKRFEDNPLVSGDPNIRFYAGCPLHAANGHKIGTLCLIDQSPRQLSAEDQGLLEDLTRIIEDSMAAAGLATTDELTGISNRRGFNMLADKALKLSLRMNRTVTMLVLDLDEFKSINDRWGHAAGDEALKDFAACLVEAYRDCDVVGRAGGDEFCVFLSGGSDSVPPTRWNERLDRQLARRFGISSRPYRLEYSLGSFSCRPDADTTLATLWEQADAAMYREKNRPSPGTWRGRMVSD